jgi:AraC family transcriptional regulator of adaptative response/methylated-DNA-[protein]-cysteine methyltransferase
MRNRWWLEPLPRSAIRGKIGREIRPHDLDRSAPDSHVTCASMESHGIHSADAAEWWQACLRRDRAFDGRWVYAVRSTGIYCHPSCPARKPKFRNIAFFSAPELARQAGFRPCKRCRPDRSALRDPLTERMLAICRYLHGAIRAATHGATRATTRGAISSATEEPLTLARLGKRFSLSPAYLQRVFKQIVGISPLEYAEACRMDQLKLALRNGASVTEAIYAAGFSSSSRVYERAASSLGMTPRRYRLRGQGTRIFFSIVPSSLGKLLVATTKKGICAVKLGKNARALEQTLREEFSDADIRQDGERHRDWVRGVIAMAAGQVPSTELPLDIRGTAFQKKVWQALLKIPAGSTRSYAEVAASIGRPEAVRAVANACGANPTALVVPCHRVIRSNGELGGYGWGIERKRALLERENPHAALRAPRRRRLAEVLGAMPNVAEDQDFVRGQSDQRD